MEGRGMLKVTSILMIIFGILAIVGAGLLFGGIAALGAMLGGGAIFVVLIAIAAVISMIGAILELITGIYGNRCCKNPTAAALKKCFVLDLIIIILCVISLIFNGIGGTNPGSIVFSAICGLLIPVLYMIGVLRMKNSLSA